MYIYLQNFHSPIRTRLLRDREVLASHEPQYCAAHAVPITRSATPHASSPQSPPTARRVACLILDMAPTGSSGGVAAVYYCTRQRVVVVVLLPASQKQAIVTPSLKKAGLDVADMTNYRPIFNISFLSFI